MVREGEKEVTLRYLRRNPRLIAFSHYSDGEWARALAGRLTLIEYDSPDTGQEHTELFELPERARKGIR